MMNKWKITKNNIDKFTRLGNIFPNIEEIYRLFDAFPNDLKELLKQASNTEEEHPLLMIEYLSKSQEKTISRLINLCLMEYGIEYRNDYYALTNKSLELLSQTIYARYFNKWSKLYQTTIREYDYLKPYDMVIREDGIDNMTSTSGVKQNSNESEIVLKTRNLEDTNNSIFNESVDNITISDKTQESIYGFNSVTSVPTDESENTSKTNEKSTNSSKDTLTRTGTENENNSLNSTRNIDTTYDRENPYEKNITRNGNIGNITLQELTEKEREVLEYQFWDTVFKDLDSTLVRSKYIFGGGICQ